MLRLVGFASRPGTLLDPCCGSGTILLEAASIRPESRLYGVDVDPLCAKGAQKNLLSLFPDHGGSRIYQGDARKLEELFPADGLDYLVTNPPFGIRTGTRINFYWFYRGLLNGANRLLNQKGRIALLIGRQRGIFNRAVKRGRKFQGHPYPGNRRLGTLPRPLCTGKDRLMDFLFESRFNALMEGISGQFGTSPLGLLLFILALAALPLFLSLLYLLQKHREKQARTQRSREIIRKRCDKIGLSPAERELVERISECAAGPEPGYLVLFDEPRFHKAAEKLQKKETGISSGSIAALRVKLGFSREATRRLHSTAQLQVGDPLLVRPQKKQGVFKALITAVRTDGFEIAMEGNNQLTSGDSAAFQYQNRQGSFLFKSYCIKRSGGRMLIRHQEKLKQLQKRAYFRAAYHGKAGSRGF